MFKPVAFSSLFFLLSLAALEAMLQILSNGVHEAVH